MDGDKRGGGEIGENVPDQGGSQILFLSWSIGSAVSEVCPDERTCMLQPTVARAYGQQAEVAKNEGPVVAEVISLCFPACTLFVPSIHRPGRN